MMSNYQRTMELTGYATNSAGASQKQFEKTMDSLESKLNRLHDAWEQFTTGIANQTAVKGVVDLLTNLLTTVNNITDALDPLHTGWSKILAAFLGFKAAKGVVNGVLRGIGTQLGTRSKTDLDEKQGAIDGSKYGKGFWGAFKKIKAQKRGDLQRPITDELKSKKQNLKNAKQAASLKQEATQMKAQSQQLKTLSNDYNKYNQTLSEAAKGKEKYQKFNKGELESLKKSNLALQQHEEQYRRSLPFESKAYQASEARTVALKKQEAEMVKGYNVQQLKNQQDAIGNIQTTINTEATNLNAAAIDNETRAEGMNAAATEAASKAQMIENIHTEAASMTRGQAILGLFSLSRQKRLAAMEALGLASATEVEAMVTKDATAAQTAFNAALYSCPIMWIITGVAALTAGLIALAVVANNNSLEKQLEAANENAEKAAEKAQELTDAYNNLLDRKDKYNNLQEELQVLQEGTIAFKEKVLEANQAVLDLLQNYPSLSKYVESKNGILAISDEGWDKTLEEQLKNVSDAQVRASAAALYALDKQVEKDVKDTVQNIVKGTTYDKIVKQTSIGRVEKKTEATPYKASDFSQEDQKKLYNSILSFYQKGEIARINEKDRQQLEERGYKIVKRDGVYYGISSEALNEVGQIGEVKLSDASLSYLASSLEKVNENNLQKQSQINAATLGLATNVINSINPNINDKTKNSLGQFLANNFNQETFAKEIEKRQDYYGKGMYWGYGEYRGEASTGEGRLRYEYEQRTGLSSKDEEGNYIDIKEIRAAMAAGDVTEKYMGEAAESFEKLNKINKEAANNLLALGNTQVENLNITDKMGEILLGPNGAKEFVNNVTEAFAGSQELEDFAKSLGYTSADSFTDELSKNAKTVKENYKQNIEDTYRVIYGGIKIQSIPLGMWDTQVTDYAGMQKSLIETFGTLQTALDYSNLFKNWKANSGIDFSGLFFNIDKSIFESGIYEELEKIDFSNPIQAASEINKLSANTDKNWQKIGDNLKSYAKNLISTQNQFKQIFSSIDSKDWEKLAEDFTIDRDELNELKTELPELQTFLDNTGVSANTVSKYFTKLAEGTLSLYNTSEKFIEALDKINAGLNNIEDSIDFVENFETSKTATTIGDSFSEYRETLQQSLERGQYGDLALIDYTKMILGNDNFDKYYNEFEGNLQKVEELAFEKINLWGENFYGLWTEFSKFSDVANIGENGEINFDLSEINSIDDLSKLLQEKLNISDKVADAAIADAQTYSSNFSEALNQLSLGDAISTFLKGSFSFQGIKYINEQELNILADESGIDADKLKQEIQTALDNANIKYTFNAEPVLTDAGGLSEEIATIIEKQMSDELQKGEINLDSYFGLLVSNGLSDEQARQEINNMLEDISEDFSDIKFEFSDGSLKKTEKVVGSTIADAVSNGEIDGLMSPEARYAQKISAVEQGTETAKQIAKGIYLGYAMAANLFDENTYQQKLEKIYGILEVESEQTIADIKQLALEELGDTAAFQQIGEQVGNSFKNGFNANSYINIKAQEYGVSGGKYDKDETKDTSSDSDWTNDYDKYYNTLKKIEGLERKRTELEKQQSRLTKQRYLDEEKIQANKKAQVDLLKQQARINSDLADTAAAYLRGDSNGDVWFDEATGTIQTNPNAAYYNEEQMKAFNDQKSLMEDHYETWKEAKDNLEDIYDAIDELTEVAEFSLEDLTDSVDRAIEVLDNTLTNLDREISRLDRYNSGATSSDYKKRYEQSAQTYADKYNQLTTKKAINEQQLNGQMYSEYGKYINVDWNAKEVTKSAEYYAITDPDVKDKVDEFVSEAQEIASNIIDMDNQQEEIRDSLYELQQTLADKSLEFQEKVYDAVIKSREDEITTLNTINNSIKDAASELISSIQKNIQKIRQERSNKKTEEELSKMQSRLDFLRMDTSSGNQKAILDLEKQLEDKEESYTDALIDQKISELQDQNTEAEKQRKRQIEIMETQLELSKENGAIWTAVDDAIKTGFNSSGRIQKGSDLYNMLSSLDEVTKKNSVQFERWFGELSNLAAAYNANLTANLDTEGQMSDIASNSNDVYGENSFYIKTLKNRLEAMNNDGNFNDLMWYDQEAQQMRYKYSHYYASSQTEADDYNKKVADYTALANELANARAFYKNNKNSSFLSAFKRMYGYDTGGLADYTGLAWLDGTPTSPEMVLSSQDTKNFIQLKDILADIMIGQNDKSNKQANGDYYFEIQINVDKVAGDYDVDQIAERIKRQISDSARYRNVNTINMIR